MRFAQVDQSSTLLAGTPAFRQSLVSFQGAPPFYRLKSLAFIEHLYHEDRLNYPLKRIGGSGAGKWQRSRGMLPWMKSQKNRFMNLFGSPNHANAGQWCSVVSRQIHAAIYGAGASRAVKPPCKCAVIWGGNPAESFACIFPQPTRAKRKGTKYIVIDPKYSETVGLLADHHLKLRPGTDAALALGWLNVIIEEKLYDKDFVEKWCHGFDQLKERVHQYPPERVAEITRLPQDQIVQTARLYATSKPASPGALPPSPAKWSFIPPSLRNWAMTPCRPTKSHRKLRSVSRNWPKIIPSS